VYPTTDPVSSFEKLDGDTGISELPGEGESGESGADDEESAGHVFVLDGEEDLVGCLTERLSGKFCE